MTGKNPGFTHTPKEGQTLGRPKQTLVVFTQDGFLSIFFQ